MQSEEIDLFGNLHPLNKRWDRDQNAKILNIVFQGATFGNFLKYFIDKFSKLSPEIPVSPFEKDGTSHNKIIYSGLIQKYMPHFINDNKDFKDLPVCLILPDDEKDFLFLKIAQKSRNHFLKTSPDMLWKNKIENVPENLKLISNNICKLYKLKDSHFIPKYIVRDYFKLDFLNGYKSSYNFNWFSTLKNHIFFSKQKTYHFPLKSFFSFDIFMENIKKIDHFFNLQLDFNRITEMQDIFMKGYELDDTRKKTNLTFDIIKNLFNENSIDMEIPEIDVIFESFLYAEIEKTVSFIQMPLTSNFYKNTKELKEYLNVYPEHYKAMNPNLPKFNGKDNPFYLWKHKNQI